ncbi:MAG: maltotransferase domain-containing protein, partial [Euryarchaeota archaeon]|nr:maltotransferase domain-containing protein [Euryarchaeota archaeon]
GGRYPIKREVDRPLLVTADICGPQSLRAELKYRSASSGWMSAPMIRREGNGFQGTISFPEAGIYSYTIEVTGPETVRYPRELEVYVEPVRARFAAWYEMFHRSQGKKKGESATFRDMEARLPDLRKMGFNVIYLPPVHPVGITNRKGPNNSLRAGPRDPGSPWSVGNKFGGHKAINPELGTISDFRRFVRAAEKKGMEIALDFTSNCSPDHPWIREHPEWFFHNPDGSIRYAENPPKKYEDVCPLDFTIQDYRPLWEAVKDIFIFWIKNGVFTFRVDNPHTKPDEFWEWLIREIKRDYPAAVFLAEAFTDYDQLEGLARAGFSQSYSYFTWRNSKNELIEYFSKLTGSYLKEFLRVNLFTNTPDILSPILQEGGRPAFKMRVALAATLSSLYGIYNGYELLENEALPAGSENYKDSEKYQYKTRDWNKPGNIKDYIGRLNRIREENPALHYYDNLKFYNSTDDGILFYGKTSPDRRNIILVAINLDPFGSHTARITVPVESFGISSDEEYSVRELITDRQMTWRGREQVITLSPEEEPAAIFRLSQPL